MLEDRRPTILLVEDNADEEALIMRAIRKASLSCQVLVAHTTEEALDFLFSRGSFNERESLDPDVVITDLRVRSIGGAELTSAIRENQRTRLIPVVVLTGSASIDQIEDLYQRGANSFLIKPMDFDEFSKAIAEVASYWGNLNIHAPEPSRSRNFPYSL